MGGLGGDGGGAMEFIAANDIIIGTLGKLIARGGDGLQGPQGGIAFFLPFSMTAVVDMCPNLRGRWRQRWGNQHLIWDGHSQLWTDRRERRQRRFRRSELPWLDGRRGRRRKDRTLW